MPETGFLGKIVGLETRDLLRNPVSSRKGIFIDPRIRTLIIDNFWVDPPQFGIIVNRGVGDSRCVQRSYPR